MEQHHGHSCNILMPNPMPAYLSEQPDEVVAYTISWCDFSSLVSLRATNHRLKRIADKILEERALEDPPVRKGLYRKGKEDHFSIASLHPGDGSFSDRNVCIECVLDGVYSIRRDDDRDTGRHMLRSQTVVDIAEFPGIPEDVGWKLRIDLDPSVSTKRAWEAASRSMLLDVDAHHDHNEKDPDYSVRLRQCLFSLLVVARPSSIQQATWNLERRYASQPMIVQAR
jgi:hypothetical protein